MLFFPGEDCLEMMMIHERRMDHLRKVQLRKEL
jgi:hypothetical protein